MSDRDARRGIALLRLASQRLVGPPSATPLETVRWLTAMQAQDHCGVLVSVALRTRAGTRADAVAALDAGHVVKSWPLRGTLHFVAAEDLSWMLRLLASREVAASRARRTGLGLTEAQLEQARELVVDALRGGGRLSRAEVYAVWEAAGLATGEQRGAHMLRFLALTGTLVFGPTRDSEQLLVLVDEWIRRPRSLDGETALGELALRFFRSHGPATLADLVRWAGLRITDARTGLEVARPRLASIEVGGVDHLMDPLAPTWLAAGRTRADGVLLLPGFDEFILGYGDRTAQLDPEFADRIVPGGNGVFRPTVVSAGRVVGTWTRTGRGAQQSVIATPFTEFAPAVSEAVPRACANLP